MARERPLIEQPFVSEVVAEAHATYSRFHDIYDGLTWRLCRDPIPNGSVEIVPGVFAIKSEKMNYPGFCVILLVYTLEGEGDAQTIILEDIRVDPV